MPSLLYPAMQKLYSALNSLEKFNKENNFFDNISCLDTFLSEYRNITFVLQKSLAHTEFLKDYEKLRDKYLLDCKWFVEKRNETTKQQPFQLVKKISISIYYPEKGFDVISYEFNVENDIEFSTLLDDIKDSFAKMHPIEVFFSAKFSFYEKDSEIDLYNNLTFGIKQIQSLINDLKEKINEKCDLCEKIEREIKKFYFALMPKDIFLVNDYVYYPKKDEFERASRIALLMGSERVAIPRKNKRSISWDKFRIKDENSLFEKFVLMHIVIQNVDIMPVIMVVYKDDTFELDAFNSDIKTTVYRKLNEAAQKVLNDDVKEVYYMTTYVCTSDTYENLFMTSKQRIDKATDEFLTFMKVDYNLREEEIKFNGAHINCQNYILQTMTHDKNNELSLGRLNMQPIINAFKSKREVHK